MSKKPATAPSSRRIQTRRSGVHGKGVFAVQDIAAGETLIEYVGEIISWDGRIRDIRKQTQAEPGGEVAALLHTIEVYSSARNRKGIAIEAAMRDWARRDAQAVAAVDEVDAERLACACRLFLACGLDRHEAEARSVLLYAYVFGASMMRFGAFTSDVAGLKAWIAGLIAPQLQRSAPVAPGDAT